MESGLIIQDFQGRLGADMAKTSARLIKSGSWKRQRIIVVLPADSMIPAKVALSHWNLVFPPNNGVLRILAQGMEVGSAYSAAIEGVLAHPELNNWEYLLSLEHDNMPPNDGILKLLETMEEHPEFDCVSGLYFTKGEGGCAQVWGDPKDPVLNFRPLIPVPDTVMECCGVGMGFALWRLKMFKDERLVRPFFKTQKDASGVGTQDLCFWTNARKFGHRCAVDCRVRVGHFDASTNVCW